MKTIAAPYYEVEPDEFDLIWPDIRPEIVRALETCDGEAGPEDILAGLKRGTSKMLLFKRGEGHFGCVYQMLAFPRFKVARVHLAFGKNMRDVAQAIEAAEQWGKSQGCKYVEGFVATDSRVRLFSRFGYRKTYTVVRKELR